MATMLSAALLGVALTTSPAAAATACAWTYPRDLPLQETNARYWRADIDIGAGESIELKGAFPHARQMSFNVHRRADNGTLAAIADEAIEPDAGAINPFRQGAMRNAEQRTYAVRIVAAPGEDARNTIRLPVPPTETLPARILYRIYLPDSAHPGGGAPLPELWRVAADGARTRLTEGCPDPARVSAEQPRGPTRLPPSDARPLSPLEWRGSNPPGAGTADLMINRDNAYAYGRTDYRLGEVLPLSGKAPTFPRTAAGAPRMGGGQVRYWSLCAYRHPPDRTAACLADEAIPLGPARRYHVIVGPPSRRPATLRCGAVWLDALTEGEGALLLRHVAPDPGFTHSPRSIGAGASAAAVLGPYEPAGRYMTLAEAQRRACARRR